MAADGGTTWASLPVATLRSQRLFSPLSFITVSTYFASGDMAATTARLELVSWVMAKFWKGAEAARCSREYAPNPAAPKINSTAIVPTVTANLCFLAAAIAELLVVCPEICAGFVGIAGVLADDGTDTDACAIDCELLSGAAATDPELVVRWRESVSRFSRFRSAR